MRDIHEVEQRLGLTFTKNREGFYTSKTHRQCTNCLRVFEKTNDTVTLCKECNSNRVKSMSAESRMYNRVKTRARNRGIEFSIEKDDVVIPRCCPILGIPLVAHNESGSWNDSPSLDRINPDKGYVKGNVWVISGLANAMKSNASTEQLIRFSKWVLDKYD